MLGVRRASKVFQVDDLRLVRINEVCAKQNRLIPSGNVDRANLPPCKRSLIQHIRSVNLQVGIWKRAHISEPIIPNASQGHGREEHIGNLHPLWYKGDILPREPADVAQVTPNSTECNDNSDTDSSVVFSSESDGYESDSDFED